MNFTVDGNATEDVGDDFTCEENRNTCYKNNSNGSFLCDYYFLVDKFQNRQYKNLAMEMENATLPLVYVDYEGRYINCLHGYTTVVDTTMLRDCITPVTDDKKVTFAVDDKNGYAKTYSYELRSISSDSLIENGDLTFDTEENGYRIFDIDIRMDIKPDTEYMLIFKLDGADGQTVRYYTRIVVNDNYHASELLDFVEQFNASTFDYEANEEGSFIYPYMQAYKGQDDDSLSMGHLNLTSSYKELVWSGVNPVRITSIIPQIKEIDVNYAVIELDYVTMAENTMVSRIIIRSGNIIVSAIKNQRQKTIQREPPEQRLLKHQRIPGKQITQAQYPL